MDWKKIKAEYIAGGASYRKLAEKYGVSFNTLKTHAVEEQWYKLRQQKDKKTTTKLIDNLSNKGADIDLKYYSIVDKLLAKAEELIEQMPEWNVASIKDMATAMKSLKECKGVKSDIDLREQEARIRNLERQAKEEDQGDKHVIITLDGDLSKYSK